MATRFHTMFVTLFVYIHSNIKVSASFADYQYKTTVFENYIKIAKIWVLLILSYQEQSEMFPKIFILENVKKMPFYQVRCEPKKMLLSPEVGRGVGSFLKVGGQDYKLFH